MARPDRVTLLRGGSGFARTAALEGFRPGDFQPAAGPLIEARIAETQSRGKLPLWDGYQGLANYGTRVGKGAARSVNEVRSGPGICRFYSWLVTRKAPEAVLEFGAAFGASGMYWLAGMEEAGQGRLYSFEPNALWCAIARENFAAVSTRATLVNGTFEANIAAIEPGSVGIALIDAIHTREFVLSQFALVRSVAAPGALVIFDDIDFSEEMRRCWQEIARDPAWPGVWNLFGRAGMIELPA